MRQVACRLCESIEEVIENTPNSLMPKRINIDLPSSAAAFFRVALPKAQTEERVYVLPLDANGKVLAKPILVSVGHQDGTATIDAGAIFREALKAGAEEVIVAHNHPSGDLTPSKADIAATRELADLGKRLSTPLVDHLIIGLGEDCGFLSLAEYGYVG